MKLKIIAIKDRKDLSDERIVLQATQDCNVGDYLVFDTTYTEKGKVSNEWRHVYIFPRKPVKKGEIVRIFTRARKSTDTDTEQSANTPLNHNFYWGINKPVWNDDGDCAHLFEIADRASYCVGKDN